MALPGSAWLQLSLSPFPVQHPGDDHGTVWIGWMSLEMEQWAALARSAQLAHYSIFGMTILYKLSLNISNNVVWIPHQAQYVSDTMCSAFLNHLILPAIERSIEQYKTLRRSRRFDRIWIGSNWNRRNGDGIGGQERQQRNTTSDSVADNGKQEKYIIFQCHKTGE